MGKAESYQEAASEGVISLLHHIYQKLGNWLQNPAPKAVMLAQQIAEARNLFPPENQFLAEAFISHG